MVNEMARREYLVIGLYEDNLQRFATFVTATCAKEAERRAVKEALPQHLLIAGVVSAGQPVVEA